MPTTSPCTLKLAEIRSRIEPDLKEEATRVLAACGLNVSDAIRLFGPVGAKLQFDDI
jgi:DNA-damage-inducible protein J